MRFLIDADLPYSLAVFSVGMVMKLFVSGILLALQPMRRYSITLTETNA